MASFFSRKCLRWPPAINQFLRLLHALLVCTGAFCFILLPMEHLLLNERSNSGPEETSLGLREIQLRSPQHAFNFRPAAITLLGEFEFTESAVAALPPPYVQRMLKSYTRARQTGHSKVLLIHVQHGLSNRIRAYLSAKAFAKATGRHLRVIWTPDLHCLARFGDLFENAEDVWDEFVEAEVASNGFATFDYMNPAIKYQFIEDGPRNIYVRSAYLLNVSVGGQDPAALAKHFQDLDPVSSIKDTLRQFHAPGCHTARDWWPCTAYVGVHVRQGTLSYGEDNPEDLSTYLAADRAVLKLARTRAATPHFVYALRVLLVQNEGLSIFVASDTAQVMEDLVSEFGSNVITLPRNPRCTPLERGQYCLRHALADLLMLAHSSHPDILGSYWSSFTEVAAIAHQKRILRASIDFQYPGLAPLNCNPPSLYALPPFNGVSICTALTPSRVDLLMQALPTWLAAKGVDEIIVVDYMAGNDTRLTAALQNFTDPRLKYVKVEGTGKFDLTRAYNLAVRHSRGSRVMKLDSDNKILPDFVANHPRIEGSFYAGNWKSAKTENERHLNGVYFVDRALWAHVNGFDERIVGYGHDDDNLHMRLSRLAERRDLNFAYIKHIEHGDSRRAVVTNGIPFMDVSILFNTALTERLEVWDDQFQGTQYDCSQQLDASCDCVMTVPVPDIHSGLSAEDERRYLVRAYRQVVGYSVNLPEEKLAEVDSLPWFEGQLQLHYQKVRRPWVVLHPIGTCSDRAAAIASALLLAEKLRWPLRVVWQTDESCRDPYHSLFGAKLDVMEEFYPWEVNFKYAEYDLTVGPDWILPSTDFTSSKKSVFIHARGPFGDALLARSALASAHDALLLRSDFTMRQPRTETLLLLVELRGGLPERLLDLSRGIVLSRNLNRRLVLVWESHEVGGIELQEILEAQYLVLTPANLATGLPPTNLPIVFVSVHDLAARQNGSEHVRVGDVDKIGSGLIDEVVFNTAVGLLRPVFPLKEATFRLLVGRNFRGLVVDRGNACGESALFAGLKMSLADAGVQRGTYFAAIASDEMCAYMEAAGAICARWCDGASGRNCHMRHLAMTLALTKLKVLYFTSWSEKSVDWVLRLGLIPGVLVGCSHETLDDSIPLFQRVLAPAVTDEDLGAHERAQSCPSEGMHLISQYPVLRRNNSAARQAEFDSVLATNLAHERIVGIHLLLEFPEDEAVVRAEFRDPCGKLHVSFLGRRLFYSDSFAYANEHLPGKLCAQAHSDISFEAGLEVLSVERHLAGGGRVLALSRHEKTENDSCGRTMCYRYENTEDGFLSSDAFVFLAPLPQSVVDKTRFEPQTGSENVVIWALKRAGMDVRNPCRTLRVFHNHCSNDRSNQVSTVQSWERKVEPDARIDMKSCGKLHCGDGYCERGPEVLEDLEQED